MKRHSSTAGLALAVLAVLGLTGPATAGEQVPFKGSYEGTYTRTPTSPTTAHVELIGAGTATQLGQFTLYNAHDVYFVPPPPTGIGYFVLTSANGDTVYGTVYGQATPVAGMPGVLYGVEQMTILGGTGRFAGASGSFISGRLIDTINLTTIGSFEGTISSPGS